MRPGRSYARPRSSPATGERAGGDVPTAIAVDTAHHLAELPGSPHAEDEALAAVCGMLDVPIGTFNHLQVQADRVAPQVRTSVEVEGDIVDRMRPGIRDHPLFELLPSAFDVLPMSEVISLRRWLSHPLSAQILGPADIPPYSILVPIDSVSGYTFVMLNRQDDFRDSEITDLTFLQGALVALRRRDAVQRRAPRLPDSPLTDREHEVLLLLDAGLTVGAIARRLLMQPRTAAKHIQSIHRKLGTVDRLSTVRQAALAGWLPAQR